MANELELQTSPVSSGLHVYGVIRSADSTAWNTSTVAFEAFQDSHQTNYAVTLAEQGTTGFYVGNFPTGISTPGTYSVVVYSRAGSSPAVSDSTIGQGSIVWDGTQEVASSGGNLISLSYAKAFLKITASTYDAILATFIAAASSAVKTFCRNNFVITDYVENYDLDDYAAKLTVRNYPITTLTSVTLNPYGSSPVVVSGSDYIATNYGALTPKPSASDAQYFPPGCQSVQVSYSAGYATIPADVQQATAMIVARLYSQLGKDTTYSSERLADYQYQLKSDAFDCISEAIQTGLMPYRRYAH